MEFLLLRQPTCCCSEVKPVSCHAPACVGTPLPRIGTFRLYYKHVREYCTTEESADSTCPKPSLPKSVQQNSSAVLPATSELQSEPQSNATKAGKRQRLCSVCHCPHTVFPWCCMYFRRHGAAICSIVAGTAVIVLASFCHKNVWVILRSNLLLWLEVCYSSFIELQLIVNIFSSLAQCICEFRFAPRGGCEIFWRNTP